MTRRAYQASPAAALWEEARTTVVLGFGVGEPSPGEGGFTFSGQEPWARTHLLIVSFKRSPCGRHAGIPRVSCFKGLGLGACVPREVRVDYRSVDSFVFFNNLYYKLAET